MHLVTFSLPLLCSVIYAAFKKERINHPRRVNAIRVGAVRSSCMCMHACMHLLAERTNTFLFFSFVSFQHQAILPFGLLFLSTATKSRSAKNGIITVAMIVLAVVSLPCGCGTYTMPLANKRAAW